jgi:signal transduction histidine kinase
MQRTVLLVTGQTDALASARALLERAGHRVLAADRGAAALAYLDRERVQVVLVDLVLPDMSAEELMGHVRERDGLAQLVLYDRGDAAVRLLLAVDMAMRMHEQLAQLQAAERLKSELLGNVSHEFRTPLNVIVGYVELLREGAFGPPASESVPVFDKVLGNASYLLELAEDFLDLSKLEAGAMAVRREAVALTPFLREVAESFGLLVRDKPIEFVTVIPDGLPAVSAEAGKLRVVIQNLLSNAQKFTARGRIGLAAEVRSDGRVAILVSDTGPGIAPEDQEAIFDVFHQLRPQERGKGVGLGLALARRFARMMEGDVLLESVVGKGSTFTVLLRVASGGTTGERPHDAAA